MKETYIKQVKRCLILSRNQKMEVIRDLREIFSSAFEHGETEQQVIERLGSPRDLASSIHEQLGIDRAELHSRKCKIAVTVILAVAAFALCLLIKRSGVPHDVIGQADGLTSIRLNGTAVKPYLLLAAAGAVALIAAIAQVVRYFKSKKELTV